MSLTQKFRDAVSGGALNITALCIGTRYIVIHCDRVDTKNGDAVRLTLREEDDDNIVRVFLPRHYGSEIAEDDMTAINNQRIKYYLTYKTKSTSTDRPMLDGLLIPTVSLLQNSNTMRISDQDFDGAKEFYFADWWLQFTAGSARLFPEFSPVNFIALRFMFELLKHFWRHEICCHIGGYLPTYLAGL